MKIQKGMYGLTQAVKIANDKLKKIWPNLAISQHPSRQACGGTKQVYFNFHWQWMKLG